MLRLRNWIVCVCVLAGLCGAADSYSAEIQKWRAEEEKVLLADTGPLGVVALHTLKPGTASLGSSPKNDIVVEVPGAPERIGTIRRGTDSAVIEFAPGIRATFGGKLSAKAEFNPKTPRSTAVGIGNLGLGVRWRSDDVILIVRDRNHKIRREWQSLKWFPIDERYRVTARFTPFAQPKKVKMADTDGGSREWTVPGTLAFEIGGKTVTLEPADTGNSLSLLFRDETSGKESYAGGRSLQADLPKNGKVVLDFNKATNFYCAYNPVSICPVPPRQNRLPVRIAAGEMAYPGREH